MGSEMVRRGGAIRKCIAGGAGSASVARHAIGVLFGIEGGGKTRSDRNPVNELLVIVSVTPHLEMVDGYFCVSTSTPLLVLLFCCNKDCIVMGS
jgi:hypothetical protein